MDGRRGSRDSELYPGEVERLVEELTVNDSREASSTFRSLLIAAIGSCASEADRGAVSRVGEPMLARSIIFGRPADTYETMTAKSQLLPFSNLEMLIFLAWKHSFSKS